MLSCMCEARTLLHAGLPMQYAAFVFCGNYLKFVAEYDLVVAQLHFCIASIVSFL